MCNDHVSPFCDAPVVGAFEYNGRKINVRCRRALDEVILEMSLLTRIVRQPSAKVKQPLPEMSALNALA